MTEYQMVVITAKNEQVKSGRSDRIATHHLFMQCLNSIEKIICLNLRYTVMS